MDHDHSRGADGSRAGGRLPSGWARRAGAFLARRKLALIVLLGSVALLGTARAEAAVDDEPLKKVETALEGLRAANPILLTQTDEGIRTQAAALQARADEEDELSRTVRLLESETTLCETTLVAEAEG